MANEPNTDEKSLDDGGGKEPIIFPPVSARFSPPSGLQRAVDCAARRAEDFLAWLSRRRTR